MIRCALLVALLLQAACTEAGPAADVRPPDQYRGEGLAFPDHGPVDARGDVPDGLEAGADLRGPDLPPPKCSVYSDFSCSQSSNSACVATCTGGSTLKVSCTWSSFLSLCACIKDGTTKGMCSRSGTGCAPCQDAFACCKGLW